MMKEETLEWLAARSYTYLLFQRLLGTEPSAELFEAIEVTVAQEAFALVFGEGSAALQQSETMIHHIQTARDSVASWRSEYRRLFEGPAELPAPPWESVYTSNKRLLMQPTTLDVRNAYRAHGFIPECYPRVPDDHIALELDFLATLAARAQEAYDQGDKEYCQKLLESSHTFIADHVGIWVNDFAQDVATKGHSDYYEGVTHTLAAFIAADAKALERARSLA
ncbi:MULTISPECIES: TorD/DmsD family molecular chaperone [Gordonibacter]|uniref:Molecular chaperone TorD family protein n=1 Tax=Gordonibacter faecis TaxID=3047475 RepID=A0ABT7DN05_9ACTN|nr:MULTISPECIES: molecular chaperone TorD family protein [unclassified Gordonibacter]MDJ1649938.1 molecular chaperone TorD family protein [Gordonibacter sp. KGMB12511]HIW75870.1 molecular chaperone TorD family protein [Candidatus Gordonibacter avicola]